MKELIYKDQRINSVGTTSNNWYWFHLELWLFVPPIFRMHKAASPLRNNWIQLMSSHTSPYIQRSCLDSKWYFGRKWYGISFISEPFFVQLAGTSYQTSRTSGPSYPSFQLLRARCVLHCWCIRWKPAGSFGGIPSNLSRLSFEWVENSTNWPKRVTNAD